MIKPAARIELYVAERAVARHEATFQQWIETVTAPLRYVCVEKDDTFEPCEVSLGGYISNFEDPNDEKAPRRQGMSAFSGFSVARDQRGVWFRDGTGAPEEDRVTIYSFLVDRELGEVAYYALQERLGQTILRERNEQAVLMSRLIEKSHTPDTTSAVGDGQTKDQSLGLQMEFVTKKKKGYMRFAKAFGDAATKIAKSRLRQIELAWKLLHLFQLLQRDLMASAKGLASSKENKDRSDARSIYQPLFDGILHIIEHIFNERILDRMSTSVFVTWLKIARELAVQKAPIDSQQLENYIKKALEASILDIADSLWRFQGHSLAGAADLGCDSCGVEAFAFISALDTCQNELGLGLAEHAAKRANELKDLAADAMYIPLLLLRDFRGLSYSLNAQSKKTANNEPDLRELAAAFGLRRVDGIAKSGISDERTWYRSIREMFPGEQEKMQAEASGKN
jgi:hypothetical protein